MRTLLLCVVLVGSATFAQEQTPPPVMAAEPAMPSAFLDQALKVDGKNRITEGRAGKELTHRELFERMGRADLITKSEANASRRLWLTVAATSVAVVGITVGTILIATAPNLATPACENDVRIYNEVCVPEAARHTISGTASIVGGVALGLVLAGLAYGSDPVVLNRDETTSLVSAYNSRLAKELRNKPSGFRLMPIITPEGGTLTASLKF